MSESPMMTLGQLAAYLKVHPSTIYRLLKKHNIPASKIGRDWRFNRELIDKWRLELEQNGTESR